MSSETNTLLDWQDVGIQISVPSGIVSKDTLCDIAVIPILHGDFQFPQGMVLVSGVYAIGTSCKIKKPLTIHIQHCVELSSEVNIQALTFCKAEHGSASLYPYEFIPCQGGTFKIESQYGSLDCESFTFYGIGMWILSWFAGHPDPVRPDPPAITYRAQVLYRETTSRSYVVLIYAIKNIKTIIKVS